jgi:hypothetical protein
MDMILYYTDLNILSRNIPVEYLGIHSFNVTSRIWDASENVIYRNNGQDVYLKNRHGNRGFHTPAVEMALDPKLYTTTQKPFKINTRYDMAKKK